MSKTRGFVTIATGDERYFKIARNLLYSYRQFASISYPFALICDRENKYTKEFDDVIFLDKAYCSYLDKLQLYDYLPYDETIFIDADSLAYGDLDSWWNIFEKADDFSLFGYMWTDLNSGRGWFIPDGIKEYKNQVDYIPDFNGGGYYLRRSDRCKKVFELANYFAQHFDEYQFTGFITPADEPILALAMAVYDCKPIDLHEICFAPKKKQIDLDIVIPSAHYYQSSNNHYDVRLIHWSNYKTKQALYKFEVEKLIHLKNEHKNEMINKFLYVYKLKYYFLRMGDILVFCGRIKNKLKKIIRFRKRKK